jgi:hypothetical protein
MTAAVMDIFWSREPVVEDRATVHALVIGVSRYEYLPGGMGPETDKALLAGLGQLSAAATAATRIANWLRDNFEYPKCNWEASGCSLHRRRANCRCLTVRTHRQPRRTR